ncbi:hypothetical protein [Neptuniibacter caesariensis]|uniref:Solute-binding protein family 3/N-terminal domain-containing protein n=1 Tax=Neptuniibacter caesariensis TaxID=207954 RepID=A0A7U8GR15_NEPCE|nr:hypothetical protein [Neptuniibacter caesariensis]EAR59710.1 hypothetical protein MED92_00095 [Oceanospirillum sp. MED92] [Neptuniibacter caesariensis]
MYRSLPSTIALCAFLSASSYTLAAEKLVIGSFPFPPLLHTAEDGSFSGTMGETVKSLCSEANIDCSFRVAPLSRVYNELRMGKIDALITLDLNQLNDCCLKSQWRSPWSAGLFALPNVAEIPETAEQMIGESLIVVNGMRTPYRFLPDLDNWSKEGKIKLSSGRDIKTATKMFTRNRASFLWGGEDFKWHISKHDPEMTYGFKPLMQKDVIVWVRKDQPDTLVKLDSALEALQIKQLLSDKSLLKDELMQTVYKEAAYDKAGYGR